MRRALLVYFAAAIFSTLGCGGYGKPNQSDARAVFKGLSQLPEELVILDDFEKTNGQTREFGGIELYNMEYVATVRALRDCYWGEIFGGDGVWFAESRPPLFVGIVRQLDEGETTQIEGEMHFEKTERGWKGQDDAIY